MESEHILLTDLRSLLSKPVAHYEEALIILNSLSSSSPSLSVSSFPTYIFASLFSLLRKSLSSHEKFPQIQSGFLLMSFLLPKTPVSVVQSKYLEIYELTRKILDNFKVFKSEELEKSSINILMSLLQVIPLQDWGAESVRVIVSEVLQRIIEGKARARKQIIRSFTSLLSRPDTISSKLDDYVRDFAVKSLENEGREALLMTYFLNPLLSKLKVSTIGDLVYMYQKLLSKSTDELLVTHIYLTLENLQHKNPLSIDLSEGLLKELMNNQPSFYSDSKLVFSYVQCLTQTLIHMLNTQFSLGKKYLSGTISIISEVFLVNNRSLQVFAEKSLQLVLLHGVKPSLFEGNSLENLENFEDLLDLEGNNSKTASDFKRTVSVLTHLTSARFQEVFSFTANVLVCFLERIPKETIQKYFSQLKNLIEAALELRTQVPREIFNKTCEKIAAKIGLRKILEIRPINLDYDVLAHDYEEKSNLWILNSLGKAAKNENLQVFFEYFEPLLVKLQEKASQALDNIRKSLFEALKSQIWGLFAGFQLDKREFFVQTKQIIGLLAENLEKNDDLALMPLLKFLSNQKPSISNSEKIELAEKLVPKLTKFVSIPQKSELSRYALKSIGFLGVFCSKSYVDRVFKKNSEKLLEKAIENDMKTFEILLELAKSAEIRSENLEFSLKLVRKYLVSRCAMQKRAYKLLFLLFSRLHGSYFPELKSLFSMKHEVLQSSRPLRLSVLLRIWTAEGFESGNQEKIGVFLQDFLSEIVLGLKDGNRRARRISQKLLREIQGKMRVFSLEKEFYSLLTAGFAGVSGTMKAAAILAFREVFALAPITLKEESLEILEITGLLMKEGNSEVFLAVLELYKTVLKTMKKEDLKTAISGILRNLLENDKENREKHQSKVSFFLRKVIKKLGKEEVEAVLPETERKIVKLVVKAQKTEKKREKIRKIKAKEKRKQRKSEKTEVMDEEIVKESGEFDFREEKARVQRKIEENPNDLLLKYDAETEKFHFVEHPLAKFKAKIEQEEEKREKIELEMLKGRIVVKEFAEETGKKRRREEFTEENAENHRKNKKIIKGTHIVKESGETFKAKNSSHGDLLLPGKPNPYAFIQLNPKVLNKRHRNVAGKAFEQVLGKKNEGVLKGLKSSKKVKL